jgi:hypothetical protein
MAVSPPSADKQTMMNPITALRVAATGPMAGRLHAR